MLDELEDAVQYGVSLSGNSPSTQIGTLGHALYFYRSHEAQLLGTDAVARIWDRRYREVGSHLDTRRNEVLLDRDRSWGLAGAECSGRLVDEISQHALAAAKRSSLAVSTAHQVISGLGELHSNIVEHSGDERSSFIGFEVTDRFVGIYASDFGRGPLSTLHANPLYEGVLDHGDALRLVIQDGVTSTGQAGRGLGFRPIFEGLANRTGYLRFRAGDALLEISGIKRDELSLQIRQRPAIDGFHIYVHCEL